MKYIYCCPETGILINKILLLQITNRKIIIIMSITIQCYSNYHIIDATVLSYFIYFKSYTFQLFMRVRKVRCDPFSDGLWITMGLTSLSTVFANAKA